MMEWIGYFFKRDQECSIQCDETESWLAMEDDNFYTCVEEASEIVFGVSVICLFFSGTLGAVEVGLRAIEIIDSPIGTACVLYGLTGLCFAFFGWVLRGLSERTEAMKGIKETTLKSKKRD